MHAPIFATSRGASMLSLALHRRCAGIPLGVGIASAASMSGWLRSGEATSCHRDQRMCHFAMTRMCSCDSEHRWPRYTCIQISGPSSRIPRWSHTPADKSLGDCGYGLGCIKCRRKISSVTVFVNRAEIFRSRSESRCLSRTRV